MARPWQASLRMTGSSARHTGGSLAPSSLPGSSARRAPMASSVSQGVPCWLDSASMDAGNPFRQYDIGTRIYSAGTATAVAGPGGVVPGLGALPSDCYVAVVTGTPGGGTPALPSAAIALATVSVPAAAVALASGAIGDQRSYVVAQGGILPIVNSAAAPAVPATQFMYDLSRNLLVQGTGTAGSTALVSTGAWTPAIAYVSAPVTDSSAKGSVTQIASVSVTT